MRCGLPRRIDFGTLTAAIPAYGASPDKVLRAAAMVAGFEVVANEVAAHAGQVHRVALSLLTAAAQAGGGCSG